MVHTQAVNAVMNKHKIKCIKMFFVVIWAGVSLASIAFLSAFFVRCLRWQVFMLLKTIYYELYNLIDEFNIILRVKRILCYLQYDKTIKTCRCTHSKTNLPLNC